MKISAKYPPDWIDMFLANYEALIGDAAELAAEWHEMEQQEQIHHRSIAMQSWGMRRTLGTQYCANALTPNQRATLAALDRGLLKEAAKVEVCYGPSLEQLIKNLLSWGTPLSEERGTVQLDVPIWVLPTLGQVLGKQPLSSR